MKPKTLCITLALLFSISGFILMNSTSTNPHFQYFTPPANNNITNNFLVGAIQSYTDTNFQNVNDLGLNMWHRYTTEIDDSARHKHFPGGWMAENLFYLRKVSTNM